MPGPVIKEKIRFKPATLQVEGPGGGQVFVDGDPAGRVGEAIRIPMDTHLPKPVEVKVLFDATYATFEGTAELRAGERAVISIPQR